MNTESPPFERGATWFGGETIRTPPASEFLGGYEYEGKEYTYQDQWYGSGLPIRVRVVRNSAGYNILPGQLVTFAATRVLDSAAVLLGTNAAGLAATEAAYCYPADEFLPPAGVPSGDLFYIVVSGPCLMKSAKTPTPATVAMAIGAKVVSCTGSGTTDGNEGAIIVQDVSAATTVAENAVANQINNAIGRALSALTANQTATNVLVAVGW